MEIKLIADLLADGWSTDEVLRLSRTGALERIRRGAYDRRRPPISIPSSGIVG